jgi:hypothetical protein
MSVLTSKDIRHKTPSETLNGAVSFVPKLRSAEKLTGTPTVTATPSGLTFSSVAVNTSAINEDGFTADIGKAVQFAVTGGSADTKYTLTVTGTSDATPAQTLQVYAVLWVKDE